MKYRALIACRHLQETIDLYRDWFARESIEIDLPHVVQQLSEEELLPIIDQYDGVIAGDDYLTARVLEAGKRLKVVAKWGVGVDAIDRGAARRLGIAVYNTPDVFGDEVADVSMGYVILLARQLHRMHQSVVGGGWLKVRGISLSGRTLGVVGVGSIGRAVARRGATAGMRVLGYDPVGVSPEFVAETGFCAVGLEELIQSADFIALQCNLTRDNYHMLSHREFAMMKQGVYIVNTARGPLIDEEALVAGLRSGKVAGAALDVFETEPLPADSPLREFDGCIFGTHNASNTIDAVLRVNERAVQNLIDGLKGVRR